MDIIPSIIGSTNEQLQQQSARLRGLAPVIHFDVRDGKFVPGSSPQNINNFFVANQQYDIHLMVSEPALYIQSLHHNPVRYCFIHAEVNNHNLDHAFDVAREREISLGLALSLGTPLERVAEYEREIKAVLIMAIEPGEAGRAFDHEAITRVAYVKDHFSHLYLIVDGGVNEHSIPWIYRTADAGVVHSALFNSPHPLPQAYRNLRRLAT